MKCNKCGEYGYEGVHNCSNWILTVYTPSVDVFEAYWWGYGKVVEQTLIQENISRPGMSQWMTVVNYDSDKYRCEMQSGRFASGLYFSKVEETV